MIMRSHQRMAMAAAALLVSLATESTAQSCLGVPNGKSHSLGVLFSGPRGGEGDDGAPGLTFGMTTASGESIRLEASMRPIVLDNVGSDVEDFMITRLAGTLAQPLGSQTVSGTTTRGLCGMMQLATAITSSDSDEDLLGREPSPTTSAYSVAAGAAWAISTPSSAFYAGPLFGISSADGETALFTTFHAGAGFRLARLLLNGDLNVPVGIENSKSSFDVRLGFMW
jgi:hypothetical protein